MSTIKEYHTILLHVDSGQVMTHAVNEVGLAEAEQEAISNLEQQTDVFGDIKKCIEEGDLDVIQWEETH